MKRLAALAIVGGVVLGARHAAPTGDVQAGLYFPRAGPNGGIVMETLLEGPLVVRNACVEIGDPGDYTLPVWRDGFTARWENGRVVVRNPYGDVIAVQGENFSMGGGYIAEFRPKEKVDPKAAQLHVVTQTTGATIPSRCLDPDVYGVWWVGDTDPLRPG